MRRLSLFIPNLFSPDVLFTKQHLPNLPALNHFLSRSHIQPFERSSFLQRLQRVFELKSSTKINAAISHLADDVPPHDGFWLRADPVHLQADHKGLFLFDSRGFSLTRQESLALAADIRPVLLDLGAEIQVPVPERWYLRFAIEPEISTTPIYDVLGKDIQSYLPTGKAASHWAKVMNEIQMVLHESEINQQREAREELPINSLWCWGEGILPETDNTKYTRIYSNDALVKGLAQHNATVCSELVNSAQEVDYMEAHLNILCVLDEGVNFRAYHDFEGWLEWLQFLETYWFEPLLKKLKTGFLNQVHIYVDDYEFRYSKWSSYCIWRKRNTLASFQE